MTPPFSPSDAGLRFVLYKGQISLSWPFWNSLPEIKRFSHLAIFWPFSDLEENRIFLGLFWRHFYKFGLFKFFATWGQFHQHSTCSLYVHKLRGQLFCAYILGLYFTGVSLAVQKLPIECWWNWPLATLAWHHWWTTPYRNEEGEDGAGWLSFYHSIHIVCLYTQIYLYNIITHVIRIDFTFKNLFDVGRIVNKFVNSTFVNCKYSFFFTLKGHQQSSYWFLLFD